MLGAHGLTAAVAAISNELCSSSSSVDPVANACSGIDTTPNTVTVKDTVIFTFSTTINVTPCTSLASTASSFTLSSPAPTAPSVNPSITTTTSSTSLSSGTPSSAPVPPVAAPSGQFLGFDVDSTDSVLDAAAVIAKSMLTPYYAYQATINTTDKALIGTYKGDLWWWWTAGASWGTMLNYWAVTKDETYTSTITEAILAQKGENDEFMPAKMNPNMGNDDIGFWAFTSLNAIEYGFPEPESGSPSWLQLTVNAYQSLQSRWNTNPCGGLRWQALPSLKGYEYVNAITNGAYMQVAARLYYLTGDDKYADEAEKVWQWSTDHGLVNPEKWQVYDGFGTSVCKIDTDHPEVHLYNHAVYMYGAAVMANRRPNSNWTARAEGLLASALQTDNYMSSYTSYKAVVGQGGVDGDHDLSVADTGVLWTPQCELEAQGCTHDDSTHKAFLASWLAKTAVMMPAHKEDILRVLKTTASALVANQVCKNQQIVQGQEVLTLCGAPWFRGSDGVQWIPAGNNTYDDYMPQYMSALEVLVSLEIEKAPEIKPVSSV